MALTRPQIWALSGGCEMRAMHLMSCHRGSAGRFTWHNLYYYRSVTGLHRADEPARLNYLRSALLDGFGVQHLLSVVPRFVWLGDAGRILHSKCLIFIN